MNGFTIIYNFKESVDHLNMDLKSITSLKKSVVKNSNSQITTYNNKSFEKDQVYYEDDSFILIVSGVILNLKDFTKGYTDTEQFFFDSFLRDKEAFLKMLRGSFCGVLINKSEQSVISFTDHLSTKRIYFFYNQNVLFLSTLLIDVLELCEINGFNQIIDYDSSKKILTFGFNFDSRTLYKDIYTIDPGCIHNFNRDESKRFCYYRITANKYDLENLNETEIINLLDEKFKNAVKLQFKKDLEYDYKHFVGLSGGLDSRMTAVVAHELGYTNQLNFTFSQTNYLDESIPKKISSDFQNEWLFKSLDNGIFLKNLDKITKYTGGNVLYYGLAHTDSLFSLINFEGLGIIHSGQLGDIIIGSLIKNLDNTNHFIEDLAYSNKLLGNNKTALKGEIENIEIEKFYLRGIHGANSGLIASQMYSETISPFYDVDFLEFCFSIPIRLRMNHSLYKKWVCEKYNRAASYKWEKIGRPINKKTFYITFRDKKVPLIMALKILFQKLFKVDLIGSSNMNPLNYWFENNKDLKSFLDNYFKENVNNVSDIKIKELVLGLYDKGTAYEKNQVLSLIAAYKMKNLLNG